MNDLRYSIISRGWQECVKQFWKEKKVILTVYLARQTGDDAVIIVSALLGLVVSKNLTVQS